MCKTNRYDRGLVKGVFFYVSDNGLLAARRQADVWSLPRARDRDLYLRATDLSVRCRIGRSPGANAAGVEADEIRSHRYPGCLSTEPASSSDSPIQLHAATSAHSQQRAFRAVRFPSFGHRALDHRPAFRHLPDKLMSPLPRDVTSWPALAKAKAKASAQRRRRPPDHASRFDPATSPSTSPKSAAPAPLPPACDASSGLC